MNNTIIAVNRSSVLTDDQIKVCLPAFQQSMDDFASIWGIQGTIGFAGSGDEPADGSWQLMILDHTDTPGAGGYHYDQDGQVGGKVFAADAIDAEAPWTIDFTHEMLEMLGDPLTGTLVTVPGQSLQWFREVCDPCEADQYGYLIGEVWVTDFVTPAYGDGAGPLFDFKNNLTAGAPTLLPGGYVTMYDPATGEYHQKFAKQADGKLSRRALHSRRMLHIMSK